MTETRKQHSLIVFLRAQLSAQFATLVDFVLTYVCFHFLGFHYLWATSFGTISGGITNCLINYKWAFKTDDCQFKWVLFKYILVWIGSFGLNVGGVFLLVELLKRHTTLWEEHSDSLCLMVVKIIVSITVSLCWNYLLHRHFVFRDANIHSRLKNAFKKNE